MSVPQQTLDAFVQTAKDQLCNEVHYWQRNTPYTADMYKSLLSTVDAIIVLLPNNSFKHSISSLPSGTKSELVTFIGFMEGWNHGTKHIFIGYIPSTGKPTIYSASYSMYGLIEGVGGSARNFGEYCNNYKIKTAKEAHDDLIDTYNKYQEERLEATLQKRTELEEAMIIVVSKFTKFFNGSLTISRLRTLNEALSHHAEGPHDYAELQWICAHQEYLKRRAKVKDAMIGINYASPISKLTAFDSTTNPVVIAEVIDKRILLLRSH